MKFFFFLYIASIIWMLYGLSLSTDPLNIICVSGFITVSSSIIFTSIGKENMLDDLYKKISDKN